MKQSENLTKFYQAYLAWAEAGAPHREPFSRRVAMCGNMYRFAKTIIKPIVTDDGRTLNISDIIDLADSLENEMCEQFKAARLDHCYPFNNGCFQDYDHEGKYGYRWQNPDRMAWVKSHAEI